MRTCGSPFKTTFNVHITIFLNCLDPDLYFKDFSGSFLYWWKHILAHVRRELVRRLGIGFLYIQLENNFCSQAFQIDLAVSLFPCFYILTFASSENNLIYCFWLRFFFSWTWNIMCLFCFVLKIPPPPKQKKIRLMKIQFSPYLSSKYHPDPWLNFLSSALKTWRLSGWSVCLCRVSPVGKHLGILYLLYKSGLQTRRNSSQWESSFI